MRHERPCDCAVCLGLKLAIWVCAFSGAIILLLAVLVRLGDPMPLAVDKLQEPPVRHSGVLRSKEPEGLAEVIPPVRYQGEAAAVVLFSDIAVKEACGGAIACAGKNDKGVPIVALPNPCRLAGIEIYATIVCHETGHVNGWPGTHGA